MITLTHPALARELKRYAGGLFVAQLLGGPPNTLVVKCPVEMIQAAKILSEIKFYFFHLNADGVSTYGLITAFFDDIDEPLVIRTPLVDDQDGNCLIDVLCLRTFDVHFFDEHNREFLGYRANNQSASKFSQKRKTLDLAPSSYIPSPEIDNQMMHLFSTRSSKDDDSALVVQLIEELFPSDFIIWDSVPQHNSYQGRKHDMFTTLERENAGLFSELDIIKLLQRVFASEQIFLNPVRVDNGKEFVDVMVVTSSHVLLVQAKDSPNTEEMLRRPIERKISTTLRHMNKAAAQLRGSIRYVSLNDPFIVQCGNTRHTVDMDSREVVGMISVKELFSTEYKSYSQVAFDVFEDTGTPCIILDYSQFHQLTYHRRTENTFFATLEEIMIFALHHDEFPRLRFWL